MQKIICRLKKLGAGKGKTCERLGVVGIAGGWLRQSPAGELLQT